MSRFDLGMSIDYCPNWGVVESVREIFQNALDAQTVNPDNKMYFEYSSEEKILRVGNKNGSLSTESLLLGSSTKRSQAETIGQHGEGYKVATVVLLRNGKTVRVINRGNREIWTAKIVDSRRYGAKVCVFDVEKNSVFKSVPDHDLIFEVGNITQDEFNDIKESNLHLQDIKKGDFIKAGDSRILLSDEHKGKIFVKGLFVCKSKFAKFGYDLSPTLVKLDRDRGLIDSFDLQWACGKLICATNDVDFIDDAKNLWDGEYVRMFANSTKDGLSEVYNREYNRFIEKNGSDAIPVVDTEDFNRKKKMGINAVMVTRNDYHYITSSSSYQASVSEEPERTLEGVIVDFKSWFDSLSDTNPEVHESGVAIVEELLSFIE